MDDLCVAVTVGCGVSAGWLQSFMNMNSTITSIMQFPGVNGKYLINSDLASLPITRPGVYVLCLSRNPHSSHLKPVLDRGEGREALKLLEKNFFLHIL